MPAGRGTRPRRAAQRQGYRPPRSTLPRTVPRGWPRSGKRHATASAHASPLGRALGPGRCVLAFQPVKLRERRRLYRARRRGGIGRPPLQPVAFVPARVTGRPLADELDAREPLPHHQAIAARGSRYHVVSQPHHGQRSLTA